MSRIGKMPVQIPENVEMTVEGTVLKAKGSKGELRMDFEPEYVDIKIEEGQVVVTRKSDSKEARSRHGLYRSLAANLMTGVSEGFSKTLEINGVGYRAALKGQGIELSLGYSHPISYDLPQGIEVKFDEKKPNVFTVSGIDKQLVGQVSAEIRSFRPPEPYKGKGIKYMDEHIARKAGKSAAKAEA